MWHRGRIIIPWIFGKYKKLRNKMEQFDAVQVLIDGIYFPQRGAHERCLTDLHHGGNYGAS